MKSWTTSLHNTPLSQNEQWERGKKPHKKISDKYNNTRNKAFGVYQSDLQFAVHWFAGHWFVVHWFAVHWFAVHWFAGHWFAVHWPKEKRVSARDKRVT